MAACERARRRRRLRLVFRFGGLVDRIRARVLAATACGTTRLATTCCAAARACRQGEQHAEVARNWLTPRLTQACCSHRGEASCAAGGAHLAQVGSLNQQGRKRWWCHGYGSHKGCSGRSRSHSSYRRRCFGSPSDHHWLSAARRPRQRRRRSPRREDHHHRSAPLCLRTARARWAAAAVRGRRLTRV